MQRFAAGLIGIALLSVATTAAADIVTFRFDGVIDSVDANLGSELQAGDRWSLTFQWLSGPQTHACSPSTTSFCDTLGGDGSLGGLDFGMHGQFSIDARPDYVAFRLDDHFNGFTGPRLGDSQQFEPTFAELAWRWHTAGAESAFPPAAMPGSVTGDLHLYYVQFAPGSDDVELARQHVFGHVTSVSKVPTPSTLLLTLVGLGGALGFRRRAS